MTFIEYCPSLLGTFMGSTDQRGLQKASQSNIFPMNSPKAISEMSCNIKGLGLARVSNWVLKNGLKFHLNLHLNERRTLKVNDPIRVTVPGPQPQSRSQAGIHSALCKGQRSRRELVFPRPRQGRRHGPRLFPQRTWTALKGFFCFFSTFFVATATFSR